MAPDARARRLAAQNRLMAYHDEVLSPSQKRVLRQIGSITSDKGFYLAGGTAIAIHLGHRRSADLDWFTSQRITDVMLLAREVQDKGIPLVVRQIAPGTLHGQVSGVRVTILEYRYPLLRDLEPWAEYGCALAPLDDLACMKLSAIAQRGAKKDFVDIYALGLKHLPLADMLSAYQRKYGIKDIAHILYGLAYFDDADRERMPTTLWDLDWRSVKRAIRGWVKELVGST